MPELAVPRETIDLRLAGLPFHVTYGAPERPWVEARFGAYRAPADAKAFGLDVHYDPDAVLPQPGSMDYPGFGAERLTDGTSTFLRLRERLVVDPVARHAKSLVASAPPSSGTFAEQPTSLDSPLRVLLSLELDRIDGLLLHASGFADRSRAVVFAAPSGGGKTTTARKMPPDHVLSDDQVAVVRTPAGWMAWALPFVGMFGRATVPRQAPLRALALLEKAPQASVRRLRPAEAAARLLGCVVQHGPLGGEPGLAFDRTVQLATEVPTYALQLAPDTAFDEILRLMAT